MIVLESFYEKYQKLCHNVGMSPSGVANAIGLSNAAASGWKKGKVPSEFTMFKLADYFGVSVAYLKGEEEQKENPTAQMGSEADAVIQEIMGIVRGGTDADRRDMLEVLRIYQSKRNRG